MLMCRRPRELPDQGSESIRWLPYDRRVYSLESGLIRDELVITISLQSIGLAWRRFWSARLVKRSDFKGRNFTITFKVYLSDDGNQTCRMSFHTAGDAYFFPMRPEDIDHLIEVAQAARGQLNSREPTARSAS
ncbi:hypothetical protein [Mesorhizobium sp. WSM4906]|uniref:hypothetical protein n=1 Tax=Mesorhizobium sp. WSM4906 TaxID=3038546 RepID=UPI0024164B10|nr:hypothetical protein [Mesorhizobium sp. WSM4906]WFP74486.1 hypothetical protein QAZ22_22440 [Mesorhizobium sp. WSM4906]